MLKLTLTLDNIDYDSLIERLWPIISGKLEEELSNRGTASQLMGKLLGKTQGVNISMAKGLINTLPADKQEALVVKCIDGEDGKIASLLESIARDNGIILHIADLDMESVD